MWWLEKQITALATGKKWRSRLMNGHEKSMFVSERAIKKVKFRRASGI